MDVEVEFAKQETIARHLNNEVQHNLQQLNDVEQKLKARANSQSKR